MEDSSIIGFLIFWLLLSFCVGILGNEKKIGYWGVVLCSILLSPIVGLIIGLFFISRNREKNRDKVFEREEWLRGAKKLLDCILPPVYKSLTGNS